MWADIKKKKGDWRNPNEICKDTTRPCRGRTSNYVNDGGFEASVRVGSRRRCRRGSLLQPTPTRTCVSVHMRIFNLCMRERGEIEFTQGPMHSAAHLSLWAGSSSLCVLYVNDTLEMLMYTTNNIECMKKISVRLSSHG